MSSRASWFPPTEANQRLRPFTESRATVSDAGHLSNSTSHHFPDFGSADNDTVTGTLPHPERNPLDPPSVVVTPNLRSPSPDSDHAPTVFSTIEEHHFSPSAPARVAATSPAPTSPLGNTTTTMAPVLPENETSKAASTKSTSDTTVAAISGDALEKDDVGMKMLHSMESSSSVPIFSVFASKKKTKKKYTKDSVSRQFHAEENAFSDTPAMKKIRRQNWISVLIYCIIAVVLMAAGAIAVAFVSRKYLIEMRESTVQIKNRVVLNSSLVALHDTTKELVRAVGSLMSFVTTAKGAPFSTTADLRDSLKEDFLRSWSLWLSNDETVRSHIVRVPFCASSSVGTSSCPTMMLSINCSDSATTACTFSQSTDDGLNVEDYELNFDSASGLFSAGKLRGKYVQTYSFSTAFTSANDSFFLNPQVVDGSGLLQRSTLTLRRQWYAPSSFYVNEADSSSISSSAGESSSASSASSSTGNSGDPSAVHAPGEEVKKQLDHAAEGTRTAALADYDTGTGGHKHYIVVDAVSYLQSWFFSFNRDLQKSSDSIVVLFTGDKTLFYSFGSALSYDTTSHPCTYQISSLSEKAGSCGEGYLGVVDKIVNRFTPQNNPSTILSDNYFNKVERVDRYIVAYQNFLQLFSESENSTIYYAAYATPIEVGLGREGSIQVAVCVIILVVCILLLGVLTILALNSLQNVMCIVSRLASHVATYDTDAMERTLTDFGKRHHVITKFSAAIRATITEFYCILENLQQYRPFLPQALLMGRSEDAESTPSTPPARQSAQRDCSIPRSENLSTPSATTIYVSPEATVGNQRLLLSAFRSTNATIMAVCLTNLSAAELNAADAVNMFIHIVITHVSEFNGVVDVIEANRVMVSFNSHYPVLRHQERACECALAIRDDFERLPYSIAIGIASGPTYLGTVGTETQKARVVTGDTVHVAYALTTLKTYLGSPILVTGSVSHESTTGNVPLDVISIFFEHSNKTETFVVSEVAALDMESVPEPLLVAKKVFRMMRNRRVDAASDLMYGYITTLKARKQPVPWTLTRLSDLLSHQKARLKAGYARRQIFWDCLEREDILKAHLNEELRQNAMKGRLLKGSDRNETVAAEDEATRAKMILQQQHEQIGLNRRAVKESFDSSEALFNVVVFDDDAEELTPVNAASATNRNTDNGGTHSGSYKASLMSQDAEDTDVVPLRIKGLNGQMYYRTNELLGKGAFGEVYKAIAESGTFVALKVLYVDYATCDHLIHEVEALTKLRNDYVVTYDSCAVRGDYFFIFTEYMAAGSMQNLIKRLGCIPPKALRRYCRDILSGLRFLHSVNVNHCDLKPDNILLTAEGVCKLADFGTAALGCSTANPRSVIKGTPRYMAPEAVLGVSSPSSDIYSFGLTVAQMMTGVHPWSYYVEPDDNMFLVEYTSELNRAKETHTTCTMEPHLPPSYEDAELLLMIQRCCSFVPTDRPTAEELLNYLS